MTTDHFDSLYPIMKLHPLHIVATLSICWMSACQPATKPDATHDVSSVHAEQSGSDDGMSIYHLPASWNTQHEDVVEFRDLKGDVLVVVMIYTSCPTACPRLVADMKQIESKVAKEVDSGVKYVFVSIDPETDTPEKMRAFSQEQGMDGDQWLFLQGTTSSVQEFANVLAVKYARISPTDFSHSNIISVFDKGGVMQLQIEGLGVDYTPLIERVIMLGSI
jgi:protein SCO1/2